MATNAIKNEKVKVNGITIKPSRKIEEGDIVEIYKSPIWRLYKVNTVIEKRVSAPLAKPCIDEVTPIEDLYKLEKYIEERKFYLS